MLLCAPGSAESLPSSSKPCSIFLCLTEQRKGRCVMCDGHYRHIPGGLCRSSIGRHSSLFSDCSSTCSLPGLNSSHKHSKTQNSDRMSSFRNILPKHCSVVAAKRDMLTENSTTSLPSPKSCCFSKFHHFLHPFENCLVFLGQLHL